MAERTDLPPAIRRWMDRAVPSTASLSAGWIVDQRGEMELRPDQWGIWRAQEEFVVARLGFEFRGKVRVGPMVWMKVSDGLAGDVGWGRARVWGVVPVINQRGEHLARAQLVRNLTDLPFAPQAVAANRELRWEAHGDDAATVRVALGDREVAVRIDVDGAGDAIRASVPDRPRNLPGRKELADTPYRIEFSGHRDLEGVRLPTRAEAFWDLPEGTRSFNRVEVTGAGAAIG